MIKKEEDTKEKSITESFLGGIPILGDLVKELGKTETFKKRFEEVNEKIKENLRKGHQKKWSFESNILVRPIIMEMKEETSEISLHEDYFYGKKGNKLTLTMKVPQEEVNWKIEGKNLLIKADHFEKKIELPGYFKEIKKKQYQERILILELIK